MKKFLEESGCGIATWIEHVFFNIAVICLKLAIKLALLLLGQNSLCNELNLQHLHGPFNSSFTSMLKRTQHIKTIKFQQTFLQIFLPCLEKIMPAISCLANRDFAFSTDLCRGNKVGQDYKCSDRRCEGEKKKKKKTSTLRTLDKVSWAWRDAAVGKLSAPFWRESSSSPTTWKRQQLQQDNTEWCPSVPQTFPLARLFFEFMAVLIDAGSTLTNVFPPEAIPTATGSGQGGWHPNQSIISFSPPSQDAGFSLSKKLINLTRWKNKQTQLSQMHECLPWHQNPGLTLFL